MGERPPPPAGLHLFPCGLPYPENRALVPRSPRRRQRWAAERRRREWLNHLMAYLTWLSLSRPGPGAQATALSAPLSTAQEQMVRRFRRHLADLCRPAPPPGAAGGGLARLERALDELGLSAYGSVLSDESAPLDVDAASVSLPKRGAALPLCPPRVPPEVHKVLEDPAAFRLPESRLPALVPPACLRVRDLAGIAAALWDRGMLDFIPVDRVPVLHGCPTFAGLFGVTKKASPMLRLIVDRRRQNAAERSLPEVVAEALLRQGASAERSAEVLRLLRLPHASQLCDMFLGADERVHLWVDDAKDFYYLLCWPEAQQGTNAIGFPLDPGLLIAAGATENLGALEASAGFPMAPVLKAPAMGDQKAAELAQCVGQHTLRQGGALPDDVWLTYRQAPPAGRLWRGQYIDDLGTVGVSRRGDHEAADRIAASHAHALHCWEENGIVRHPDKAVEDAEHGLLWGGEIRSEPGDVGAELAKLRLLVCLTCRLLHTGRCSVHLMRKLLGSWCHAMSFRRAAFCVFDASYRWVSAFRGPGRAVRRLPYTVRDELIGACLVSPLLRCDLRTRIAPEAVSTDATLERAAVVMARLSAEEQAFLWARARRGAGRVRLEGQADEAYQEEVNVRPADDVLLHEWLRGKQFRSILAYDLSRRAHINVQEMKAHRTAVKRVSKDPALHATRLPMIKDSVVVSGAVIRGRSASPPLNRLLQSTLPFVLGANLYPLELWARSAFNPSDDGTRRVRLRTAEPRTPIVSRALAQAAERWPRAFKFATAVDPCRPLILYDFFAGKNCPLGSAFRALGWAVVSVDLLLGGEEHDLSCPQVVQRWCREVRRARADAGFLAPVCSSFSQWMYLQPWFSRSPARPWGDGRHPKEALGNALLRAALDLATAFDEVRALWALEQPRSSLMWHVPQLQSRLDAGEHFSAVFDWCRFNRPWRKTTRVDGRCPWLPELALRCLGGHQHVRLEGAGRIPGVGTGPRTSLAAEYSREWCERYAALATEHCRALRRA